MYNKVILIGNLGRDVELKNTPSGKAVGTFSLAVEGGARDKTEWVNIEVWEKTAENCANFIAKGSKVHVEGRLKTDSWDKEGQKHYKTSVVANRVIFLDKKQDGGQAPAQYSEIPDIPFDESELPF